MIHRSDLAKSGTVLLLSLLLIGPWSAYAADEHAPDPAGDEVEHSPAEPPPKAPLHIWQEGYQRRPPKHVAELPPHVKPKIHEPEMLRLPNGLSMSKYETTQKQWRSVMGSNPSFFIHCGDNCPVERVSWNDIQSFIQHLNTETGKHYRLPTEEEWYTACQADKPHKFCGSNIIENVAWYEGNSGKLPPPEGQKKPINGPYRTHTVGLKRPNAWGLYDMSGNVWELTDSCYEGDCNRRVYRGGSGLTAQDEVMAAYRSNCATTIRNNNLGFRLVQDER